VLIETKKGILLSIDASTTDQNSEIILPSFYIQNGKNTFFDLSSIENMVPTDIWKLYKNNVIKDENDVFSGFSETEILKNIEILLQREPDKKNIGNVYFKKDLRVRTVLEDIRNYIQETKKTKKC
jgi:hypothetical protein